MSVLRVVCGLVALALTSSVIAEDKKKPAPFFKEGDTFKIAQSNTPLKVGNRIYGYVQIGETCKAQKIDKKWMWTSTTQFGRKIQGWVLMRQVVPTAKTWTRMGARIGKTQKGAIDFLDLSEVEVSNQHLACLRNMPALKDLILSGKSVSDAGIENLMLIKNLQVLVLTGTDITDKAVPHLSKISKLQTLVVEKTRMTDDGVKQLKAALPNTIVQR